MSDEDSGETGKGESVGSVGVSWVDERLGGEGDNGEGVSVLDLFTGLRKRDFLEDLRGEESIRAEIWVREGGLASG
jgi:hypothetical protein